MTKRINNNLVFVQPRPVFDYNMIGYLSMLISGGN